MIRIASRNMRKFSYLPLQTVRTINTQNKPSENVDKKTYTVSKIINDKKIYQCKELFIEICYLGGVCFVIGFGFPFIASLAFIGLFLSVSIIKFLIDCLEFTSIGKNITSKII